MSYPRTRQLATRPLAVIFYFLFSIFCASSTFALDPSLDISQYAHTSWKVREGFVPGEINSITQTPDGYLWLGTDFGLYRFDGVRAVPWQPRDGQQLPRDRIHRLLVARDGTLWIGMLHGLASWKDGKLTKYPEIAGSIVTDLLEDHDGTIWFGVLGPGRLCAVRGGKVECFGAGSLGLGVSALYEDSKGNLWVPTSTGVWRWAPGVPEQYPFSRTGVEVNSLVEDDGGSVLLATSGGAKRLAGGRIMDYALPIVGQKFRPSRFFRSSDGSLWIGADQGLLHVYQTHADTFGTAEGLSGDSVTSIFEDREGNVWVSTLNGLDRFREYSIPAVSRNQGLSTTDCHAIQATFDGTVWISTSNGLNAWHNGHVSVYGSRTEPRRFSKNPGGLTSSPRSLGLDNQGHLYVSTVDGIFYFGSDHFVRVPGAPRGNIWSITGDAHGKLWVVDGEAGLFYFAPGEAVQAVPWSRLGQNGYGAISVSPDGSKGSVWLGFGAGGIVHFEDGEVQTSYTSEAGLGVGRVTDLRFGADGTLWAATDGGLSRIRDGRITTLTSKNGLPCDTVHWSIEDDDQFVWLYMACGLVRIARPELDAWAINPERSVQMTVFDASDGVSTVAVASGYRPLLTKSPDSKIWFVTTDGVSVIDPRHLPYNKVPPPVHIEKLTADGKEYDPARGPLPPLVRDLTIDYTALSLVVPEKVRFRVKLEGQDKDWRELVNVRHVEYTNLAHKHYRFLVKACNNSGVWNEEGAALDFVIPPAWYQTNWFRASCVLAFLALLWALYQLRLRQLARQFNMRLEERVGERTRIAHDLHDTLLQTFQGLVFRFQAVRNDLPDRPEDACEALDSALVSADQALAEGRSSIQELRSELLKESNIEQMLLATGRELASSQNGEHGSPPLRVIVEGTRRAKQAMIREEIYRIARELLRNAYRHAHARSIEAELRYDDDAFVLIVRDDGKGIDPNVLKDRGRAGHWGLRGAYERAEGIGARLDVWSEAGAGTEVRLTVPGTIAYEKSGDGGRFKLFRKTRIYERRS
jgi:signal transduction histidine kinase/ligand-binding sensor domain-containing protein